jgi:hypothetical protein
MYAVWCILLIVWNIAHSKITSNFYVSIITIVAFVIVIVLFIATNVVHNDRISQFQVSSMADVHNKLGMVGMSHKNRIG